MTGRDSLIDHVRRHLIGPAWGEEEVLHDSPAYLYTSGILFPIGGSTDDVFEVEGDDSGGGAVGFDDSDDPVRLASERLPSSVALSFFVVSESPTVRCEVVSATYSKEGDGWKRHPTQAIESSLSPTSPKAELHGGRAELQSRWRPTDGGFLVTVALVNCLESSNPSLHDPESCLFQVGLRCEASEGRIEEYPAVENLAVDHEEFELALRYAHERVFAIGHGCAADWETADGRTKVSTSFVPFVDVPPLVTADGDQPILRLASLRDLELSELQAQLTEFVDAYEGWRANLAKTPPPSSASLLAARNRILARVDRCLERMRAGVELLNDPVVLDAFRITHDAMIRQMEHSRDSLGGISRPVGERVGMPEPETYASSGATWRPFQLAFILLSIKSVVDHEDEDRSTVDLIWASTGAGKTEAYLALAALSIVHRRLTAGPRGGGTTVITRYPLRLLTAQQFERTARFVCALERVRIGRPDLGEKVTIGLWIGDDTPSTFVGAAARAQEILEERPPTQSFQLEKCPWCGTRVIPEAQSDRDHYGFRFTNTSFEFYCPNDQCDFHEVLPVQVVDEALYGAPPTVLIGTVDKFARVAWLEDTGVFFGSEAVDPPSLIIQDELHLLSGPLGTVVGLYEAAFDALCELRGAPPKLIAATATIREAGPQAKALYGRAAELFPPAGLDARDSYFVKEDASREGRGYLGVLAPSHTASTSLVRTCAVLLQAGVDLELSESERDAYGTLIAYHNSLRELGKTITFARDDIPAWIHMVADGAEHLELDDDRILELTGNVDSARIPASLDRLNRKVGDRDHVAFAACTNMLSVGVDIPRLGLMIVNGQPKTTSEYIQASSRVGRSMTPGLVVAHYSASKPRDRSHYEHFRNYHSSLYRYVEPTSVTPFSLPARNRALHAALVILLRHGAGLRENDAASDFDRTSPMTVRCLALLTARASRSDPSEASATKAHLERLLDYWEERIELASDERRQLRYNTRKPHPTLLRNHGTQVEGWATLHSMRNVDSQCELELIREYRE